MGDTATAQGRFPADFDLKTEADRMLLIARALASLDLDSITRAVEDAHTLGPFIDPTKYRDALWRGDMDDIARLAQTLKPAHAAAVEILAKHGAEPL